MAYQTYEEEKDEALAFEARVASEGWDAVQEDQEVLNEGRKHEGSEWILTSRDVWHHNPFYQGVPGPHPEMPPEDFYSTLDELISE